MLTTRNAKHMVEAGRFAPHTGIPNSSSAKMAVNVVKTEVWARRLVPFLQVSTRIIAEFTARLVVNTRQTACFPKLLLHSGSPKAETVEMPACMD